MADFKIVSAIPTTTLILDVLSKEPTKSFTTRQLAELTGLSIARARKGIHKLRFHGEVEELVNMERIYEYKWVQKNDKH